MTLEGQHLRLTQVELHDRTDHHNQLVHARQWLLHPSEKQLTLQGNLFVVDDLVAGRGWVLVRAEALPHARPQCVEHDLEVRPVPGGFSFALFAEEGAGPWHVLDYTGGLLGRARALQQWQRGCRPDVPGHTTPRLVVNTWGDRSRDSRMNEAFVLREIDAAARLGADVVQLDDGWQRGTTSNSAWARQKGGVWQGFWAQDERFWDVHPERFPRGLGPVVDHARERGVGLGLWFAPDSSDGFTNWQRDVDVLVAYHDTLGVEHVKIDGVKMISATARVNLMRFFESVLQRTGGRVVFDLDVTAETRPGYFGAPGVGPLFVENRYTDWHNWWPHHTLRNLWQLARWVDPLRLRMEFLNPARNAEHYDGDVLAPGRWRPDALFATVMASNPLGWFEASNLPEGFIDSVAPLVETWKVHRQEMASGPIVPVGEAPDGFNITGFVFVGAHRQYALLFRQLHPDGHAQLDVSDLELPETTFDVLSGTGRVDTRDGQLHVQIPDDLGYVFAVTPQE